MLTTCICNEWHRPGWMDECLHADITERADVLSASLVYQLWTSWMASHPHAGEHLLTVVKRRLPPWGLKRVAAVHRERHVHGASVIPHGGRLKISERLGNRELPNHAALPTGDLISASSDTICDGAGIWRRYLNNRSAAQSKKKKTGKKQTGSSTYETYFPIARTLAAFTM